MEKESDKKKLIELVENMDLLLDKFKKTKAYFGFQEYNIEGASIVFTAPLYYDTGVHVASIRLNSSFSNNSVRVVENSIIGKCFEIPCLEIHQIRKSDIDLNNSITLWINQNFIVRLCSLLDSYNLWTNEKPIDKSIPGYKHINLLRALRQKFAHGSGKFNSYKKEHRDINERIIKICNLNEEDIIVWKEYYPHEFPLSIDKVCIPLFNGCKKYIQNIITL